MSSCRLKRFPASQRLSKFDYCRLGVSWCTFSKMLNDNISLYCAENEDISVSFRKKVYTSSRSGALWRITYGWFYQTKNMPAKRAIKYYKDPYMFGFLAPLIFRSSCYICPYANISRCSDFTLGDFWGLGKDAGFINGKGVSAVLVNTKKR